MLLIFLQSTATTTDTTVCTTALLIQA